jgi:hypothetical protein
VYSLSVASPLEIVPGDELNLRPVQNQPAVIQSNTQTNTELIIGGEAEGVAITNTAQALAALEALNTIDFDTQTTTDIAAIDASFE